jgi:hypothetical protein
MKEQKNKKYRSMAICIFIVVILTTSITAMPLTQKTIIDIIDRRDCNLGKDDIKDIILAVLNDASFKQQLEINKTQILNEINKYPIEYRQKIKDYFNIDTAFNIDKIKERVLSLNYNNILNEVQTKILKSFDNRNQFNNTFNSYAEKLRNTIYTGDIPYYDLFCPFAGMLIMLMLFIAYGFWIMPLSLFGNAGMFIANIITCIVFAPLIIPLGFYCGVISCFQLDENYRNEVNFINFIPLTLAYLFFDSHLEIGFSYVLWYLLFDYADMTPYGFTYTTSENAPELINYGLSMDKTTKYVEFNLEVCDIDKCQVFPNTPILRDYIQVGFDFNGDLDPDYWTFLIEQKSDTTIFNIGHYFNDGLNVIHCFVRDNFGIYQRYEIEFNLNDDENLFVDISESINQQINGNLNILNGFFTSI